MKLIIDLPEEDFGWNGVLNICHCSFERLIQIVSEGTPLEEQEPCDDAISRKEVEELFVEFQDALWSEDTEFIFRQLWYRFKKLPPVKPTEKVGEWTRELIRNEYGGCIGAKMICSECGQDNGYDKRMKFCPNCGAKMKSEE